jgi:hypothetical protein
MTLTNINPEIVYDGNGVTTNWPFAMGVPSASAIDVFVTDDLGAIRQLTPAEFTVTISALTGTNPTPQGGIVIYNPGGIPLPSGWTITIVRNLDPVQNVSLANQSIIYPPVIEKEFDYLTMLIQQGGLGFDRAIKVPLADPLPADLPPQAARKNQTAFFNDNGDLVAGTPLDNTIMVSAAMQPVVQAATVTQAAALMGVYPDPKLITAGYVLIPDDNNRLIVLQGSAYYLLSANDPTSYPIDFRVQVVNNDTRAKLMNIFGYAEQFVVYPDQQVFINRGPSGWVITRPGRWRPTGPKNLFVDATLGSDNIAVADGLVSGTGAFQTLLKVTQVFENNLDGDFTINLSNSFHNVPAGGLKLNKRFTYKIVGNVGTPGNVNISVPASTIGITVSDGAVLEIHGVTFSSPGSAAYAMWAFNAGTITFGNLIFGAFPSGAHVVCWTANLNVDANYSIASGGSAQYHIGCFYNGVTTFNKLGGPSFTVTLLGPVTFASGYYLSQLNASIVALAITYTNAGFATSTPKGNAFYNGIINAGSSAIPGDQAAVTGQGGLFF